MTEYQWLVFVRNPRYKSSLLIRSKKNHNIWWMKCKSEEEALRISKVFGSKSSWVRSIPQLNINRESKSKDTSLPLYKPPSKEKLKNKEHIREKALADFAAGRDSPPWEE